MTTTLVEPASKLEAFMRGEPGVYEGIDADSYHSLDACSASRLKKLARSPLHCRESIDHPNETTDAMKLGSAEHCAVLQPELFTEQYVAAERCSARKKDNVPCGNPGKFLVGESWLCGVHVKVDRHASVFRAMLENLKDAGFTVEAVSEHGSHYLRHCAEGTLLRVADHAPTTFCRRRMIAEGRLDMRVDLPPYGNDDPRAILSPDDYAKCKAMHAAVWSHPAAKKALAAPGPRELSVLWVDKATGQLCKIRVDALGERVAWDVKTCADASPEQFAWAVRKFKYDLQSAFYLRGLLAAGLTRDGFGFIAVESEPPHAVSVYSLCDEDLSAADEEIFGKDALLADYAACVNDNSWPGYSQGMSVLRLPSKRRDATID